MIEQDHTESTKEHWEQEIHNIVLFSKSIGENSWPRFLIASLQRKLCWLTNNLVPFLEKTGLIVGLSTGSFILVIYAIIQYHQIIKNI